MRGILLLLCGFTMGAQDTGSPAGLMADCPGMNKSTVISERTIRSLYVVVMDPTSVMGSMFGRNEKKCRLSPRGALCAAKHLDLRKRKTQVIISGYMDASFSPLVRAISSQYLAKGRNVIVLEIFPILVRTYPLAARVTKPLGYLLGEYLATLTENGLSPRHLEISGGSLGAHIASFASEKYQYLTGEKPYRLTALDPAGPCFRHVSPNDRLNPSAAHKVDVLHTNIDGFGIADPLGHVDFYANGALPKTLMKPTKLVSASRVPQTGEYQPSMVSNFILPCFLFCSHVRSAFYWILSLQNPDKFLAVRCNSVAEARHGNCYSSNITTNLLGSDTDFDKPGIYYLPTSERPPYYIGERGRQKRKYDVNEYLLKPAPDEDIVL